MQKARTLTSTSLMKNLLHFGGLMSRSSLQRGKSYYGARGFRKAWLAGYSR